MDGRILLVAASVLIWFAFPVRTSPLPGNFQGQEPVYGYPYPCSIHLFPSGLRASTMLDIDQYAESNKELQLGETKFVKSDEDNNNCEIEEFIERLNPIPTFVKSPEPKPETSHDIQDVTRLSSELQTFEETFYSASGDKHCRETTEVEHAEDPLRDTSEVRGTHVARDNIAKPAPEDTTASRGLVVETTIEKPEVVEHKSSEVFSEAKDVNVETEKTNIIIVDSQAESRLVEMFKVIVDSYLPTEQKLSEGATDLKPVDILYEVRNPLKSDLIVKTAAMESFF